MRKVADWQLARVNSNFSQDWTFATLYLGMVTASDTLHDGRYSDYVKRIGEHYEWALGPGRLMQDDQAIGQSYLYGSMSQRHLSRARFELLPPPDSMIVDAASPERSAKAGHW